MRARSRHLGALASAACLLLAACAGGTETQAPEPAAPSSITGVITSIEPGQGPIESFEIDSPGQETRRIFIDPDLDYGFDLQHLHEHMAEEGPVEVRLEGRDGRLYATSIEDA